MSNTPESLAFVTLDGASAACDALERILDTHVATPDRAKVQQVIDALFAITNDTDAIVIRPSSDPHQPRNNGMAEVAQFNHAYSFAFEVLSHNEDGEDVTPDMLRAALLARIQKLSDEDLAQACDAPWDTMPATSAEGALS